MRGLIVTIKKFLRLHDTPSSYADQAGKYCRVNAEEDALEFAAVDGGGIVEGDYTSWAHKWTNDIPDGLSVNGQIGLHIDDANEVISISWNDGTPKRRFGIYNLSDFSVVFASPSDADYTEFYPVVTYLVSFIRGWAYGFYGGVSVSLQSYVLLLRDDYITIEVWRGGSSVLWSRDTSNEVAGTNVRSFSISVTGKWIVVVTDNKKLICYEGS